MNDNKKQLILESLRNSMLKHEREHFNEAIDRLMDTLIQTESKLEETEKELKKARKRAEDWEHLYCRTMYKRQHRQLANVAGDYVVNEAELAKEKLREIEAKSSLYGKGTRIVPNDREV